MTGEIEGLFEAAEPIPWWNTNHESSSSEEDECTKSNHHISLTNKIIRVPFIVII